METAVLEQRKELRTNISWPVSIWLPAANRFFNGRSANISKTGVFVRLPLTTPLREGTVVEMNFPRTLSLAKQKGKFARIKSGKVVRIDRSKTLRDALVGVGIAFN